jgi:hypothetical protein
VIATVGCAMLLTGLGFSGTSRAAPRERISVRIKMTTYLATIRHLRSFTLTCNPTGGTLPRAERICRDIGLHPQAMVDPPTPGPPRKSIVCAGGPFMPELSVTATANGTTRTFAGSPGCTWPGDQAIAVYYDAAVKDAYLSRSESELRCDEDSVLFELPTPLASVVACRHGLWTSRFEQLIKIAETTPGLVALQASQLFPHDFGALPCTIHAGGAFPGKKLSGLCGVTTKNVGSKVTISLTEDWPNDVGKTGRHTWRVVIQGKRVIATSQSGEAPPQLWP